MSIELTEAERENDEPWADLTAAVAEKSALIGLINETLYAYRRAGRPSGEFFAAVHALWEATSGHRDPRSAPTTAQDGLPQCHQPCCTFDREATQ